MSRLLSAVVAVMMVAFVGWIIFMADTAQHTVFFDWVKATPYGDKVGHVLLFGCLVLGVNAGLAFRTFRWRNRSVYWGTALVSGFVLVEEFSQAWFPNRTLDGFDLLADTVGIAVFTGVSAVISRRWQRHAPVPSPGRPRG